MPSSQFHMDIKPENILCFASERQDGGFTLKLADFGFAKLLEPGSTCDMENEVDTKTYRPPETDLQGYVSQNFDIWCLGCLYLDFVTWAILGWQGIEEFKKGRMKEEHDPEVIAAMGHFIDDRFFRKITRHSKSLPVPRREMGHEVKKVNSSGRLVPIMSRYLKVWLERPGIRIDCIVKNHVTEVSFYRVLCLT